MTPREILIAAHALIADPAKYAYTPIGRGTARDRSDQSIDPRDRLAVRWCGVGACFAVTEDTPVNDDSVVDASRLLDAAVGRGGFLHWEQTAKHADVLAAFDRAIAAAESAAAST